MLIFDIETDGLLDTVSKIHCMSISDGHGNIVGYHPAEVEDGVRRLLTALENDECVCGHNIISFDIPAIQKLYPWFSIPREKRHLVLDTLVIARLQYADTKTEDNKRFKRKEMPGSLIGSQSLKAWGYRLGVFKGTYADDHDDAWACFNEDMLEYNKQDVVVTEELYNFLNKHTADPEHYATKEALDLEHKAQWLMSKMETNGFPFDIEKAEELEMQLRLRDNELNQLLIKDAPPIPDKVFIPKRDNKRLGYVAGVPIQRYKDFNPQSRQQIDYIIKEVFHYAPDNDDLFTEEGRLKIDETTFHFIASDQSAPEKLRELAPLFEEKLMVNKRLGQLADGQQAWLKCVQTDGKIHGKVNPNGAVTGRATHSSPNVTQVPHNSSPYGKECRSLFKVPEGWTQAGIDACGLELRCLSHYLVPYDGGSYANEVVHGDIHTANQKAAGLPTRDNAKTFIYAFLYGAGDAKMGKIIGGDAKAGKDIKAKFLKATPAISKLRNGIQDVLGSYRYSNQGRPSFMWKRKYLKGLDGRHLHIRSIHSALNTLLQSAGALICKYWIVRTEERLIARGLKHGWDGDFALMAWVHDEQQVACRTEEIADIVIEEAQQAMRDTQEHFHFRVQLDTEGKKGKNWYDCH
jgi:DNA polymerase I-like protein with 3'-5' exonuclease and polymerase domains